MKKIKFQFKRLTKIRQQLYTIYFAALFLPIMIIGIFLLINTYTLLSNYHRDLLEADNLRVKTILFEMTTQVYNISENLVFDANIKEILSANYTQREKLVEKAGNLTVVDNYAQNYAEIESIEIYTDNPTFTDYKQFYRADAIFASVGIETNLSVIYGYHGCIFLAVDPGSQIVIAHLDHKHGIIVRFRQRQPAHQAQVPIFISVLVPACHGDLEDTGLGNSLAVP